MIHQGRVTTNQRLANTTTLFARDSRDAKTINERRSSMAGRRGRLQHDIIVICFYQAVRVVSVAQD